MATGYHDFTAGETLTAANLEDYCLLQGIMTFASAAARNAALAAVLREGLFAYLQDVNALTVYSGAAWSTIGPVQGGLTTWTPAIVQSGAVTSTVDRAVWTRIGRLIWCQWSLAVTGTGVAANIVTISLPVTAAGSNDNLLGGGGKIVDSSAGTTFLGMPALASTTTVKLYVYGTGFLGSSSFTAALASGDTVAGQFMYEAAADA